MYYRSFMSLTCGIKVTINSYRGLPGVFVTTNLTSDNFRGIGLHSTSHYYTKLIVVFGIISAW